MVNAFTFSKACLYAFKNGDIQTRRDILGNIGSNQRLNDKNLYIDMDSWLTELKKAENTYLEEIERFELKKVNEYKPVYTFDSFFPLMCALVDKVRTELQKSPHPPHIPDLSKWIDTTT
jgi:hypothetical protein